MRTRRLILKLAACLAAGAVVTVAVAWGCAAYSEPPRRIVGYPVAGEGWPVPVPADWPTRPEHRGEVRHAVGREVQFIVDTHGASIYTVRVSAWGWPWPSMQQYRVHKFTPGANTAAILRGSIDLGELIRSGFRAPRSEVPARPVPLGFALCTLFYAAPFLLVLGTPTLRRSLRRRRGLCPACRYSLKGLPAGAPCPECGKPGAGLNAVP